jgi:hypothetical protein
MIAASTGEISFVDGLRIAAHSLIEPLRKAATSSRALAAKGWSQHLLGYHASEFGQFEVEVVSGPEGRIQGVLMSHAHDFYQVAAPHDSERRAFHEDVISSDLRGQKEFPWGHAFCRLDEQGSQDWLVLIYSPYCGVPLHKQQAHRVLTAHAPKPRAQPCTAPDSGQPRSLTSMETLPAARCR